MRGRVTSLLVRINSAVMRAAEPEVEEPIGQIRDPLYKVGILRLFEMEDVPDFQCAPGRSRVVLVTGPNPLTSDFASYVRRHDQIENFWLDIGLSSSLSIAPPIVFPHKESDNCGASPFDSQTSYLRRGLCQGKSIRLAKSELQAFIRPQVVATQ